MVKLTIENETLMKLQRQGGEGNSLKQKGLIDAKELAGLETLESDKQWPDWSTRFKDAILARGHPAARCAMDAVEQMSEKSADVDAGATIARGKRAEWSSEKINDETWVMWANDLYYILEDMTKGNATVVVRNSVIVDGGIGVIDQEGFRAWRALEGPCARRRRPGDCRASWTWSSAARSKTSARSTRSSTTGFAR